MGITPVGAFAVDFGPETPTYYLLLPSPSVEALVTADLNLQKDAAFVKAAAPFWSAPAATPPFTRIESQLMRAFPGYPTLTPPDTRAKRIFQLRTYESPTYRDHVVKVDMFHNGEFDLFAKAGCGQVFYGDNLIGAPPPQPYLHAHLPGHRRPRKGLGRLPVQPRLEEALQRPSLRLRAHRLQRRQPHPQTAANVPNLARTGAPSSTDSLTVGQGGVPLQHQTGNDHLNPDPPTPDRHQ